MPGALVVLALHCLPAEVGYFENIGVAMQEHHPELVPFAEAASAAVVDYGAWLEANRSRMTAPAGIGVDNYNWWFKNVQLVREDVVRRRSVYLPLARTSVKFKELEPFV